LPAWSRAAFQTSRNVAARGNLNRSVPQRILACIVDVCTESMGVVIEGGHNASVGFGLGCWSRQIDVCAIVIVHSFVFLNFLLLS
jgi:hypothetical protein